MRITIMKTRAIRGRVDALPSLYMSIYMLVLASIHSGKVSGLDLRATPIKLFVGALRRIGLHIDYSADTVKVSSDEPRLRSGTVTVDIGCYPILAYMLPPVLWARASPSTTVILRSKCPWMLKLPLKEIMMHLSSLGARIWPGSKPSRLLVVEPKAHYKPLSTKIRLTMHPPLNGLIASSVIAAASIAEKVEVRLPPRIWLYSRLRAALQGLERMGFRLEYSGRRIVIEHSGSEIAASPLNGFLETSLLLVLGVSGEVEAAGLPPSLGGEEDIVGLLRAGGLEIITRGEALKAHGAYPRSFTASLEEYPHLVIPLLAYAIASGAGMTLSGLNQLVHEGIDPDHAVSLLKTTGLEVEYSEGRLVITRRNASAKSLIECSNYPQELCLSLMVGLAASTTKAITLMGVDPNTYTSKLIESMQMLGANIREH